MWLVQTRKLNTAQELNRSTLRLIVGHVSLISFTIVGYIINPPLFHVWEKSELSKRLIEMVV